MDQKVIITVEGLQWDDDGEVQRSTTVSEGEYFLRNGSHFLHYQEILEGVDAPVSNFVKIREDSFSVRKSGPIRTEMSFACGQDWEDSYTSPLGRLSLRVMTQSIEVEIGEDSLLAVAEYELSLAGQEPIHHQVRVSARSVRS